METKKCKCCGRELPIENFKKTRNGGRVGICIECDTMHRRENKEKFRDLLREQMTKAKLKDFQSRDLMEELARRGYEGKLTFTRVETIDITNF